MTPHLPGLSVPPRTLFCIGRNYAAHAREFGNAVPDEPIVFLKPVSALVFSGGEIRIPPGVGRVDHEVELVAAIGPGAPPTNLQEAVSRVIGFAVGIDVTARDLQSVAKKKGQPWALAKGMDTFAALGNFVPSEGLQGEALNFSLRVNGQLRQKGNTGAMEHSVGALVLYLSRFFTLAPGDMIYTGTPEGVGPLVPGDQVEAELEAGLSRLSVTVRERT